MSPTKSYLAALGGLAILCMPLVSHAQSPTVRFSLLDGTPAAGTSFPGVVSGNPLDSHSPAQFTLALAYSFAVNALPTPGRFEIGGQVTEADPANSAFAVDLVGANLGNSSGIPLYDGSGVNPSFFTPNVGSDGFDPTWSVFDPSNPSPLFAGSFENIDLGHLDVSKFLSYVDSLGAGHYVGTLDYGLIVQDHSNSNPLPVITPGPPTIQITVDITAASGGGGGAVPEPGVVAMLAGIGATSSTILLRRRRRR